MSVILIVDDSPVDRALAGRLLQKNTGWSVGYAEDGAAALRQIREAPPDLVVTDMQMPELNGLELVEAIKRDFPRVPVILMTAVGSEDLAAQALRQGAASYVPKANLADNLRDTAARIMESAAADRVHSRLMHALQDCDCTFVLQNDPELIEPLVGQLQQMLRSLRLSDESERLRVGVAVKHALWNAHVHGNLELPLDSDVGELADPQGLLRQRRRESPYQQRQLSLRVQITPEAARFIIRHEGPGIDVGQLPNDNDTSTNRPFVRGMTLMHSLMDEVSFNPSGSELTLIKRASLDSVEDMIAISPAVG